MNHKIEIRIRSTQVDVPWEEAKIMDVISRDSDLQEYLAFATKKLATWGDTLIELRWNYQGSLQGHYLKP